MSTVPATLESFVRSLDRPEIDFAVIADRAEIVNGKTYMMGGGWDRLNAAEVPVVHLLSFVVGLLVPWNATNQEHILEFLLEDAEGNNVDHMRGEAHFNAGRAPFMKAGDIQRVMLAPQIPVTFPAYGTYCIRFSLNGNTAKRVLLYVSDPKLAGVSPVHLG